MSRRSAASRARAREQSARIGAEIRLARATHALSRQRVAALAGVSWSTEVRVELGDPNVGVETMCAVAEAVGLDIVLRAYPGPPPSLRDSGQIGLVERLLEQANASWQPHVELSTGPHGEAIDLALFGPSEIVAIEIERMAVDFQAQLRRADRKRRALAMQHRRPVRLVMVVEDTRRNRATLEDHQRLVRTALPATPRAVLGAIRIGRPLAQDGLLWLRR